MNSATYKTLHIIAMSMATTSVAAAQVTMGLGDTLWSIELGDWVAIAFLSTTFGLVALLQRLNRNEAPTHWLRFALAHMLGSLVSGFTIFLALEAQGTPNRFFQALAIGCAAFIGASVIDRIAARVLASVNAVLGGSVEQQLSQLDEQHSTSMPDNTSNPVSGSETDANKP
jgi:hypothetical protein